jgi:heavy metal sensor kinase
VIKLHPRWLHNRLTMWYVFSLTIILLVYAVSTSLVLSWQLRAQLRRHTIQDLETLEGLLFFAPDGRLQLDESYHNHPESRLVQERLLEVVTPSGTVLYRNNLLGDQSLGGAPFSGEGEGGYSPRSAKLSDGTAVFLISRRHVLQARELVIRVAYSEYPIWHTVQQTLAAQVFCLVVFLIVASLVGRRLIRRELTPLEKIAARAQQISADRLLERLDLGGTAEIGNLATAFNTMLAHLEQSFEQLRRFTSDASHELRTPLAAIRSVGEVGLQRDGTPEEYREIIGSMLEEVGHLTRLTESLLTISRADAGDLQLHICIFPIFDLVRESTELINVLAEENAQRLSLEGDEHAIVEGDPLFLRQAFVNILHNAVKHSPNGTTIRVRVRREGTSVFVEIADQGLGIPSEHRGKIFDRFYRVDNARSRDSDGVGLGLAIAKWTVQAHAGEISVDDNIGGGCTFRIRLGLYSGSSARTSKAINDGKWRDTVLLRGAEGAS